MKNVEVHVFPGVLHGYMMQGNPKAYHPQTYKFSMARALSILNGLRGAGTQQQPLRRAV
jgi:carboxymethylenebutenolidase